MSRTVHMCLDIRGALLWPKKRLYGLLVDDRGRRLKADEVREALFDMLEEGKRVLPLGPRCEGFDDRTGCPGHEVPSCPVCRTADADPHRGTCDACHLAEVPA